MEFDNIEWKVSEGLTDYSKSLEFMEERVAQIYEGRARELVWLVEHPPLYTAGTSAKAGDLLESERFPVYKAGRGGEYTYHGPGQRVVYVLLNLGKRKNKDIRCYVHNLEQWIIDTLADFNIKGERRDKRVGIWVDQGHGKESKIAAIGIRVRKWVTYHGIAININPDLSNFGGIVPCGIQQHGVTSFEDLGNIATMEDVDISLKNSFLSVF